MSSLSRILRSGSHPPSWTLSEIVIPVRLEQGDTHKGERHFQKRSATFSEQQETLNSGQSAQYRVEAFGEQFILDLDHDASFLSPSFSVHVSGKSNVDIHDEDNSIHCFYAGHVNGHPESSAVVSLCGGMVSITGLHLLTWHFFPGFVHKRWRFYRFRVRVKNSVWSFGYCRILTT